VSNSYFYFPLDLYRLGNSGKNKIDVVRDRDIKNIEFYRVQGVDYPVPTGKLGEVRWVRAGKRGGISLFDDIDTAPIKGKFWYKIPQDIKLPDGLTLCDSKKKPDLAVHYTQQLTCR
jgi:hypothetical protein